MLESQQKALVLSDNATICPNTLDKISVNANDIEGNEQCSDVVGASPYC